MSATIGTSQPRARKPFTIFSRLRAVFHRWRGDAHNFAAHFCELHRLLDRQLGVHRVTGDHRLDTDRICPANADVADLHFASKAALISEWIRAEQQFTHVRMRNVTRPSHATQRGHDYGAGVLFAGDCDSSWSSCFLTNGRSCTSKNVI